MPAPTANAAVSDLNGMSDTSLAPADDSACVHASAGDPGSPPVVPAAPPRPVVRPLSEQRYEIRFTATEEMRERLQLAQEMLSHALPSGDVAAVFDRGLVLLVDDLARKKFSAAAGPGNSRGQGDGSRHIPAEVQRIVWVRDRGCCAFIAANGRRCGSRRFVVFHHIVPYAAGGKPTVDNIALRCRAHNGYEAEVFFLPIREHIGGMVEPMASGTWTGPQRNAPMRTRSETTLAPSAR